MSFSRVIPVLASAALIGGAGAAPNWASVPAKSVTLFYPGQSSLEWAMTPADHRGADKFRAGKACAACHTGEEKVMGDTIVSGKKNEPAPIRGKPGSVVAKVQFARDTRSLYVHLEFSDAGQPNTKLDPAAAKVAMMLGSADVPEVARTGCWAMCHDDSQGMASARGSNRTMYLGKTRAKLTRQGGGDALKSAGELAALRSGGYTLEYWQARLNPGAALSVTGGIVFGKRQEASGVSAEAVYRGGVWSATLSRRLNAGQVPVVPGKRYAVGFAIDLGHTGGRFHYVSLERTLVLGQGPADFVAK